MDLPDEMILAALRGYLRARAAKRAKAIDALRGRLGRCKNSMDFSYRVLGRMKEATVEAKKTVLRAQQKS